MPKRVFDRSSPGSAFADDKHVLATRRDVLERRAPALFTEVAAKVPELSSLILGVAQFWADNADDEVHVRARGSFEPECPWPHDCAADPSRWEWQCRLCDAIPYLSWGYGELIPAFEAYCHERGSQHDEDDESYRPYATITRGADGAIHVERVGPLLRPWLDMSSAEPPLLGFDPEARRLLQRISSMPLDDGPRRALAEHWALHGDPRGEYLSLSLAGLAGGERARSLFDAHHRAWLGDLARVVPRAGVLFDRGLLGEVELYIDEETLPYFDPDEATLAPVRSIRFLPGSLVRITPGMRGVRAMGPLDDDATLDLLSEGARFAVETLEIAPSSPEVMELLAASDALPNLRGLRVIGPHATCALVAPLLRSPKLAKLAWIELAREAEPGEEVTTFAEEVAAFRRAAPGPVVRVTQLDTDARRAAGYQVELSGDRLSAAVRRTAPTPFTTRRARQAALAALPEDTAVTLRAGR